MSPIVLFFLSIACAFSAPAWEAELSPAKPGTHPRIPSSVLDYSLSWKGMVKAGVLRIEFAPPASPKPGAYVIKSSASSQGAAATLFPYSHSYWTEIHPSTFASRYFSSTDSNSKETVVTTNRYSPSKVSVHEVTTVTKSGAVKTETFAFPHGQARDMFSAILHIRSQKLAPGEEHTLLLLPFTSPYLLKVTVEAREKHLGRDTIRLSFALRKIDRTTHALVPYKKLKKPVTVWLSDDADRVPVELRASVYIGDVRAVLSGFSKTP